MIAVRHLIRGFGPAALLGAALLLSACANKPDQVGAAGGAAVPGSQQDFVVNVGDRVFFETDSTELTPQARATLDNQSQWLNRYNQYTFTIEGHADERGTREYNIALGDRRAQTVREYLTLARGQCAAHAHDLLRQGAAGRGVRRHFLLVAEPPRGHGAERKLLRAASFDFRRSSGRPSHNLVAAGPMLWSVPDAGKPGHPTCVSCPVPP